MPLVLSDVTLSISENGEVIGKWVVICLKRIPEEKYI
jgi:hypothetical protein